MIMRCRYRLATLFVSGMVRGHCPTAIALDQWLIATDRGISFHLLSFDFDHLNVVSCFRCQFLNWPEMLLVFWSANETFNKIGSYINSVIRVQFSSLGPLHSSLLLKVKTQHLNFKKPLTKKQQQQCTMTTITITTINQIALCSNLSLTCLVSFLASTSVWLWLFLCLLHTSAALLLAFLAVSSQSSNRLRPAPFHGIQMGQQKLQLKYSECLLLATPQRGRHSQ